LVELTKLSPNVRFLHVSFRLSQPQADELGLDRLIHHMQQLGGEPFQIGLVARGRGEGGQHLGRVVLAAIEALVDRILNPMAQRVNSAAIASVEATIASSELPVSGATSVRSSRLQPT
jgi:hypothetical protein